MRNLIARILKRSGCDVRLAGSGEEAYQQLEKAPVDIVLCDVRMPEMNGLELLKQIKTRYPSTAVIIMTAFADSYSIKDALLHGADEYITKPFKNYEVSVVLERAYWRLISSRQQQTH